jgi:predicted DsbA family dithiol-disulfide isomerase/SAM-dependent methyltransferase
MEKAEAAIGAVFEKEGISALLAQTGNDNTIVPPYSIDGVVSSSLPAHRLLALAQTLDEEAGSTYGEDVVGGLFQAYFGEKKNIADLDVLAQIAADVKLPLSASQLTQFLASDSLSASVIAAADSASAAGLTVPQITVAMGKNTVEVPGAVSQDELLKTFQEITQRSPSEYLGDDLNPNAARHVAAVAAAAVAVPTLADEVAGDRFRWQAENLLPSMERSMGGAWPDTNPFSGSEEELANNEGLFSRLDPGSDVDFYQADGSRLEHHLDAPARAVLSRHYASLLRDLACASRVTPTLNGNGEGLGNQLLAILDLCSSFDSHLPESLSGKDTKFNFNYAGGVSCESSTPQESACSLDVVDVNISVVGLGMNAFELEANKKLTSWGIHDLNSRTTLNDVVPSPLPAPSTLSSAFATDSSFDMVTMALSIDYLTRPLHVLAEAWRLLKPGGKLVVSFSDRMFRSKAIALWRDAPDNSTRLWIVAAYFKYTALAKGGNWSDLAVLELTPQRSTAGDSSDGSKNDPIFVVQATKSFDEIK